MKYCEGLLFRSCAAVDPEPVPSRFAATTDISKLVRADYGQDDLYVQLMEECMPLWEEWNERFERKLFHRDGLLVLSSDEDELDKPAGTSFERDSFVTLRERGHPVERLSRAELRARFPAVNENKYRFAYVNHGAGWAESGQVLREMGKWAAEAGVRFVRDAAVRVEGDGSRVVLRSGRVLCAAQVVVAAGAWTPQVLPELSDRLKASGQVVLHLRVPKAMRPLLEPPLLTGHADDIARTGFYGFPCHPVERLENGDGVLKVATHGAGWEVGSATPAEVRAALDRALKVELPRYQQHLREALTCVRQDLDVVFERMCLYCDAPGGDFFVGRDEEHARPKLVVAAGGSGHGFKFAPMVGKVVAAVVKGTVEQDGVARYAERWQWRGKGSADTVGDATRCVEVEVDLQSRL